jgi:hypothetical protein
MLRVGGDDDDNGKNGVRKRGRQGPGHQDDGGDRFVGPNRLPAKATVTVRNTSDTLPSW